MRLSNNIHNVCELESCELTQEWEEEEKIAVKMGPSTPATQPKKEEKKEEAKTDKDGAKTEGTEGDKKEEKPVPTVPEPVNEQKYETKIKHKKSIVPVKFTTSSFAMTPKIRSQHQAYE